MREKLDFSKLPSGETRYLLDYPLVAFGLIAAALLFVALSGKRPTVGEEAAPSSVEP